ncbi:MAG: hypothetical protein HUJ26_16670 [Planctomycetaceae bacterium]|nr:hypothetical protein [Planctomycetaceae bacterium]
MSDQFDRIRKQRRAPRKSHKKSSDNGILKAWLFMGGIMIVALLVVTQIEHSPPGPPSREEKIEDSFSTYDGSHRELVKMIKDRMNDPDSFEHVETKYWDKGDHLLIYMKFRGRNSFNAVITDEILAKADTEGNVFEIIE